MIHIKYTIKQSPIHGVGVFIDQDIEQGQRVYTPSPLLDTDITPEEFNKLDKKEQEEIMYYGYFNTKTTKRHVAFDIIRLLNHGTGDDANVTQDEDMVMTTKRKIIRGTELLQDYEEFDPQRAEHLNTLKKYEE